MESDVNVKLRGMSKMCSNYFQDHPKKCKKKALQGRVLYIESPQRHDYPLHSRIRAACTTNWSVLEQYFTSSRSDAADPSGQ